MKTLFITDPSYLIPSEKWSELVDKQDEDTITNLIISYFVDNNIKPLAVGATGYGDWSNQVHSASERVDIVQPEFGADAGLVCVVEGTPAAILALHENKIASHAFATLNVPGDTRVTINYDNPNWTVLLFHSPDGTLLAKTSEDEDSEF